MNLRLPVSVFQNMGMSKKKMEKSFLGHLKLRQSAVSQFHKEMQPGITRAQWFYLHVPHTAMVHVLEIHRFDLQAVG